MSRRSHVQPGRNRRNDAKVLASFAALSTDGAFNEFNDESETRKTSGPHTE